MKKRKVLSVIMLFLVFSMILENSYIFADEENIVSENKVEKNESEEMKAQKEETLKMIDECIKEMKSKLMAIDAKEAKVKKQKEFENYPAIRLNVDTPVFGFISMVDNKLKIKKDVSTVDVANGYSIKDIVNKNKIRLPDFTVGSIVVTTKEVDIDENMSYEDANIALLKIMQYMSQLDSADEFLDFQINKTFKGYIDKDKSDKINDIKNRNNKIASSLIELDKKITYLHIMKNDEEKLKEINEIYDGLSSKNKSINVSVKDMLMSTESLTKLQKDVIDLEGKLLELSTTINNEYEDAIDSFDEEKMLKAVKDELVFKRDAVEKYINDSIYTKKIESEETKDESEDLLEEKNNNEIITKYEVTSKNTLDYLNTSISIIDEKITKYVKTEEKEDNKTDEEKQEPINQEIANKEEVTNVEVKDITKEEKRTLVDEVYRTYIDFLARENKFYLDNTNFLINDTTKKIADLTGKTNSDVLLYMKYMYIELPDKLKEYINNNSMSSMRELKKLTNSLKNELVTIVDSNEKVTNLYNEMIQEELKS